MQFRSGNAKAIYDTHRGIEWMDSCVADGGLESVALESNADGGLESVALESNRNQIE